jgi:hypothetical protein
MTKTLLAIMLASSSVACAALPPLAQSGREIKAILDSQETYTLLGGEEPIDQIVRTENGYLLITAHKQLLVDIRYLPFKKIGPAEFELGFHPPIVE